MTTPHVPVLLNEVLEALALTDGDVVVDGTFGAGGYSRAMLSAAKTRVIAIDRDPDAIAIGRALADDEPRFSLHEGAFSELDRTADAAGHPQVDAVVIDIGVSSMQIDDPDRGFSFQKDGPLDMRMSQSGETAADVVNGYEEERLADALYAYGEERKSRRVARAIVAARREAPITRTARLAEIVARAVGPGRPGHHPATRTFQALRILVNDELGELRQALRASERVLRAGGRLAVVTFHSLEDRIVKDFFADRCGRTPSGSRHQPIVQEATPATFRQTVRRAVEASAEETARNPRARSARLRFATRTEASVGDDVNGAVTV